MAVVFITGASRGLGYEVAKVFASHGYDVIGTYHKSLEKIEEVKKEIEEKYHVNFTIYKLDVSKEEDIINVRNNMNTHIDVLVNNAGISRDSSFYDKTKDVFNEVLNTNLVGTFLVVKYLSKFMDKGSIVNVSSNCGMDAGYVEGIDYNASKAGMISLTKDMARFFAPNIRVNAVAPGWIETDMVKDMDPAYRKEEENKALLKRFATPEEIAKVIYFLGSEDSSFMTGEVVKVDGGYKML